MTDAERRRSLRYWFEYYNAVHLHKALGYCSPREFREQRVNGATERRSAATTAPIEAWTLD